ncbi:hypothetical protein AN964_01280 [Heyndrickxia shackletonii]|uniref:Uncharacterized protein n=1 Tax=Heyndrickxia shackletonii TaxID=157838 RepID=A0A0Q3WVV6_9BACI|nr:hypothetical protein [Heyndrickxia shackletonii]KQL52308.1 hypothetical protein AN964_01280 [Heyndrickxia shackletonii]NEZ00328.1 hypothetical protein [Heyndrickxia shackletonii]
MKRIHHQPQSDYYDERIVPIDEKICELLKQRKEISNNRPGMPFNEYISAWATKYGFYENFLHSIFWSLKVEEHYRPMVEPNGFRKLIPVQKSVEKDGRFYSVTSIHQYTNASVVKLIIEWDSTMDSPTDTREHTFFELSIGEKYDCRMNNGSGSTGLNIRNFVVSPALHDDISGLDFIFKEFNEPFMENPTGLEIMIHVD